MAADAVLLGVRDVRHRYGDVEALRGVDLRVGAGEIVGLLGVNGAGKSTLLQLVCGLLPLQSGVIAHAGTGDPRMAFGLCPQQDRVWMDLTCAEQLELVGTLYGMSRQTVRARVTTVLADLDLSEKRDTLAGHLSGGMRRRLSVAMALLHDPALLVLDEVEAGLDPAHRAAMRQYLMRLAGQGRGILLATHSLDEAARMSHRVVILDAGRVVAEGPPRDLVAGNSGQAISRIEFSVAAGPGADVSLLDIGDRFGRISRKAEEYGEVTWVLETQDPLRALASLAETMEELGRDVVRLEVRPRELEDVFLEVTGQSEDQ